MEKILLLTSILLLASCSHTRQKSFEAQTEKPHSYRSIASNWKSNIEYHNFTKDEVQKVEKALAIIKHIINSDEFHDLVLDYTFEGEKQFNENNNYTNAEIYQLILLGAEIIGNRQANNTMDVELELYEDSSKTIGYTYPNTTRIWMNRKYFSKYTPAQVAGNLMHEWMHKLGFTHTLKWNKDRQHTVPYAIGYLIEDLATKMNL
ncbi:MAG TPA: hypothetical protein VKZ84_07375 [Bacteriovoracaceae bacterium]|nr:hypothetical protein [Bacteriovoracaceae bacterium]